MGEDHGDDDQGRRDREWLKAIVEDSNNEARKWTVFLAQNLVLMNGGAAVAVLAFIGTARLWSDGGAPLLMAVAALVAFAVGAYFPHLTALGNLHGAEWNIERALSLYQHADAHVHGLTPPRTRLQSEFDKTREGRLAKDAGRRLTAARRAFWVGVGLGLVGLLWAAFAPGLVGLWHEGARSVGLSYPQPVVMPYLGGS